MKLYSVTSDVLEFEGYKNVAFNWFLVDPPRNQRPYAELIEGYDPNEPNIDLPMDAIDELFTEEQAHALKRYLDDRHGGDMTTTIAEAKFPFSKDTVAFGQLPSCGPDADNYTFDREPGYALPFRAWAHFDLLLNDPDLAAAEHLAAAKAAEQFGGDASALPNDYDPF